MCPCQTHASQLLYNPYFISPPPLSPKSLTPPLTPSSSSRTYLRASASKGRSNFGTSMLYCISTMISHPLWICPYHQTSDQLCTWEQGVASFIEVLAFITIPYNSEHVAFSLLHWTFEWRWFRPIRWLGDWFRPIPILNTFLLRHLLSICDINSNLCLSPDWLPRLIGRDYSSNDLKHLKCDEASAEVWKYFRGRTDLRFRWA